MNKIYLDSEFLIMNVHSSQQPIILARVSARLHVIMPMHLVQQPTYLYSFSRKSTSRRDETCSFVTRLQVHNYDESSNQKWSRGYTIVLMERFDTLLPSRSRLLVIEKKPI